MKVYYDNIVYSLQKAGGISAYWSELSERLFKSSAKSEFYGYPNTNIFTEYLDKNVKEESSVSYKVARYLNFQKRLDKGSIFHSSYYRIANQKDVVNITTVHDFTYEYYRNGLAKFIHSWQKGKAINNSDGIICISENTRKDLLKFYPHIEEDKIEVIYNGVSDVFTQLQNPSKQLNEQFESIRDKKYILYVGDRSSYKNFDIAVGILKNLDDFVLVVVGGKEFYKNELQGLEDRTFHYRGISAQEINILYNNAFCLLYPSSYEGFGIPIVEAMQAGCPVVSTNISSIPEVASSAGLLVDKINLDSFVREIQKLDDNSFRNEVIANGLEQAKKFSWDKCFEETYRFYEKILKKKFG